MNNEHHYSDENSDALVKGRRLERLTDPYRLWDQPDDGLTPPNPRKRSAKKEPATAKNKKGRKRP